jgi:hypothetical protein
MKSSRNSEKPNEQKLHNVGRKTNPASGAAQAEPRQCPARRETGDLPLLDLHTNPAGAQRFVHARKPELFLPDQT